MLEIYHSFASSIQQIAMMLKHPLETIEIIDKEQIYDVSLPQEMTTATNKQTVIQTELGNHIQVRLRILDDLHDDQKNKWGKIVKQQWEFIEIIKKSENDIKSKNLLLYTAKSLTSSLRLEDVLKQILHNTMEVIDAADTGSVYLYEETEEVLIPMVTVGFDWKYIKQIRFRSSESLTGVVFKRKEPIIFQNTENVYQGMSSMSVRNRELFDLAVPQIASGLESTSKSAMASPFIIDGKCLGVITINNFLSKGTFDVDDLQLLEAICNQASFAIERAGLFDANEEQLAQVRILNESIHTKKNLLEEANNIQSKLSEMILEQKNLEEMVTEIEHLVKNPVLLYDENFNCLAASSQDNGFSLEMPVFLNEFKKIEQTHRSSTISPNDNYPIENAVLLHPIVVSNEIKGYLVIVELFTTLTMMNQITLEKSSTVLAIKLLNIEAQYQTEQRMRGEFIDDIETDINIELLEKQGKYLGISDRYNYNFISIEVDPPQEKDLLIFKKDIKRMQKNIENIILQMNQNNVTFNRMYGVKALVGWSDHIDDDLSIKRVTQLIEQINEMIKNSFREYTCSFAVGRLATKWKELKLSYKDTQKCMNIIRRSGLSDQMMTYKEVGISNIILNNTEEELKNYVKEQLGPLINHQKPSRQNLLHTLHMFFYNNENLSETANQLHLHVNTLHYRLKRIEEILQVPLKEHVLELKLAWNIMKLLDKQREWLKLDY